MKTTLNTSEVPARNKPSSYPELFASRVAGREDHSSKPRLYRVILPVSDIELAVRFYGYVFRIEGERVSPGRHYFDCGGTILACYDPVADGDPLAGGWGHHENQYLYFSVPNLAEIRQRIEEAGGRNLTEIEDMPWGERMFYALDPLGSRISFVDQRTVFTGYE